MTKKRLNRTRRLVRPWQFRARDPKPRHLRRKWAWFHGQVAVVKAEEIGDVEFAFSERQIAQARRNSSKQTKELRERREAFLAKYG